jgi:hypothetical protein
LIADGALGLLERHFRIPNAGGGAR